MIKRRGDLDGAWDLELTGASVTLVQLDQRLSVTVTDDDLDGLDVVLEGPFAARIGPDEPTFTLEPNSADPRLGLLAVALKPQRLVTCRCTDAGVLQVRFDGGSSIEVEPLDAYEAWEVGYRPRESGGSSFQVVCLPGGERAVFTSDGDDG